MQANRDQKSVHDPQLLAIYCDSVNLYNRETSIIRGNPTACASINATNFLACYAIRFADAALFLMEDVHQPLTPAAALLRTCLEAQARANHIVAASGEEREKLAREFLELMTLGYNYNEAVAFQMQKEIAGDASKFPTRDQPIIAAIMPHLENIDTSNVDALRKQYEDSRNKWS